MVSPVIHLHGGNGAVTQAVAGAGDGVRTDDDGAVVFVKDIGALSFHNVEHTQQ